MQGCDWPSLDAGNEDAIGVVLVPLDKVPGRLLGGNGNERDALIRGLEPDDLRLVLLTVVVTTVASVSCLSLGFLLFFSSLAASTFNNRNNMTSIQRLLLIIDLFFLHEQQALALDFNIIILLLCRSLSETASAAQSTTRLGPRVAAGGGIIDRGIVVAAFRDILPFLLFFLLALLAPHLVDIKKLNSNKIALESSVPVFGTANENVRVKIVGGDIGIASVLFLLTRSVPATN
ncbi:hypothetical protein MRB53_040405 [Persea americana]|nr:hypothetical protein MRB53_040405 [Persea americana]